jgi:hypothetical protein
MKQMTSYGREFIRKFLVERYGTPDRVPENSKILNRANPPQGELGPPAEFIPPSPKRKQAAKRQSVRARKLSGNGGENTEQAFRNLEQETRYQKSAPEAFRNLEQARSDELVRTVGELYLENCRLKRQLAARA